MSTRKPTGVQHEAWIDRQIREAEERGEFEGLRGTGEPIGDLDRPRDPLWWIRKKLRRENFSYLPPTLQIRRELEIAREQIDQATSERQVRQIVTAINERIRHVNRTAISGPPSTVMALDVDETVDAWRERAGRPR